MHNGATVNYSRDDHFRSAPGWMTGAAYRLGGLLVEPGNRDWLHVYLEARQDSLDMLFRHRQPLPRARLQRLRAVMRGLVSPEVFRLDADAGAYGQAAQRMLASGAAEVVVMGHTHLVRHHGPPDKAWYINTGTWIDLITVPDAALEDSEAGGAALEAFLRGLIKDTVRRQRLTYADVRVNPHGAVEYARLKEWRP